MRLITFPGQGTPIPVGVLRSVVSQYQVEFEKVLERCGHRSIDLLKFTYANPTNPGSIAICSQLYYELYQQLAKPCKKVLLGHSLGELSCLGANGLFSLNDLFDLANRRNELMVQYTRQYLLARRGQGSARFEMWALSSPKARNLPQDVKRVLQTLPTTTVCVANANSVKQCVVTGLSADLESLRTELQLQIPKLRISELTNPDGIPFHNSTVLRPIQEPLYDAIWDVLKRNATNSRTTLDAPIVANLDGRISYYVHHAIERFVKSSSNTVQFTSCYDTINGLQEISLETEPREGEDSPYFDSAVCMGPGNVVYNLVKRNCPLVPPFEYSSVATIAKYHDEINDNLSQVSSSEEKSSKTPSTELS